MVTFISILLTYLKIGTIFSFLIFLIDTYSWAAQKKFKVWELLLIILIYPLVIYYIFYPDENTN